jgi:hypothetical protein
MCRLAGCHVKISVLVPSFQDRRSGQDLWSAELAAALALFAEDTGSLVGLGRHDDFDKDYRSTNPRYICLLGAHIHEIHPHHFFFKPWTEE